MLNTSGQRGALSPKRRALLAALLKEQGVTISRAEIIQQPRDTNLFPMSFAQQRLWFAEQLEPGSPVYNHASAIRLRGLLNVTALEHSLNEIVRRHELLRTTFAAVDGKPMQVIAETAGIALPQVDLTAIAEADREPAARRLAIKEAQRPFDLARGPLLRAVLVQISPAEHILLLTIHHIITDAWSNSVLNRELAVLYEAFAQNRPSPLPELPIQYADFAVWQREQLSGDMRDAQIAYWKHQLAGAPALLKLPCDHPRPAVQSYAGAYEPLNLSPSLSAALTSLSQREGVTLFMTLLAAFKTLLYRSTGQTDLLVGSPNAGRTRSETEGLIGFFVNMLVLRTSLAGDPSFREVLQRVRATASSAYAHQDLPFEQIVDELKPERSLSHSPLFQVAFALRNVPQAALQLSNLTIETLHFDAIITSEFDITLFMADEADGLSGALEYNPALFEAATIKRMVEHFQVLLQGVVADSTQRISRLPLLTIAERRQILETWNSPLPGPAPDQSFQQLFAAQVARAPDAVAVSFDGKSLTYRELDRRANQLAHALQQHGVGPDVRVGICAERSLELVIGLLGILKAGGAYVPLDPAYPEERLQFMVEDAQAQVVLTQQQLCDRLSQQAVPVICLDQDWEQIAQCLDTPPAPSVAADNLAYVIYTSGSTGQPKGVMISHRSLCNFITTTTDDYAIGPDDHVLQCTSISWDTSVEELFPSLARGATLVLRPETMLDSMTTFLHSCRDLGITVLNLPTAVWHTLAGWLDSEDLAFPDTIRLVIIGGERARPECVVAWQAHTSQQVRLLNTYGLAETTVEVARYQVPHASDRAASCEIPIGRPFPSVRVYVLNDQLQPAPIGISGEIYVGGAGIARGYLHQPALTAERFVPDPFSTTPGARLYKTGDAARYLPDGNLEFLERVDQQVKIRGFRIELGEIEAVLTHHPAVRQAVVVAREAPGHTEKRLVAYMVPKENLERRTKNQRDEAIGSKTLGGHPVLGSAEVRAFLAKHLPSYMVPTAFMLLDALPLTTNGKLDLAALPLPDEIQSRDREHVVLPRTPIESRLAEIWSQVLGVQEIGIHDNFFELGGDSIISIQIVDRARQAGLQLTPKHLFEHQTIAALAVVVGTSSAAVAEQGAVTGPVPLTPIQRWFFDQELPQPQHWNQSLLLEVRQALDPALLAEVAGHIRSHHDALRLRFEQTASGWQQFNADDEDQPIVSTVDLSALAQAEQAAALETIAADYQTRLNLATGPLLQMVLFDLGADQPGRLLIVIHHLAIDGVSWRVLLQDLQTAYAQRLRDEPIRLPAKTTSFKQWAERLIDHAQSPAVYDELAYWLSAVPHEVGRLPLDNPTGDRSEATAAIVSSALDVEETRALLHEVPQVYRTQINEVLLTGLVQACAQWTGAQTLLVELEGHGREDLFADVDLSRTVGWFTTTFPLLLDLEDSCDVGDALRRIKEQIRRIPRRGIGYGLLRYLSNDPEMARRMQALPTPEISFNYLGQVDQMLPESAPFRLARESSGPNHSLMGQRTCLLEVNGLIVEGRLHLEWTYSAHVHDRSTIELLAQWYLDALRNLIRHCRSRETVSYTPSDFPLTQLDQRQLDNVLAKVSKAKGR